VTAAPRPIRIGTRGSALALAQAELVARALALEGRPVRIVVVETEGDRRAPDTAWGEGAFVAAIERALLDGRVDLAVHSAKDVPTDEDARLRIAAYLPRADARDALVVRADASARTLDELPPGAAVGTDSPRRSAFVRARRPDLVVRPLHGNVDTRLRRLDEGQADALVLAVAGLARLGRADRITEVLAPELVPPAPGQGAIAVQIRADDAPMIAAAATIDDARTRLAVESERAFLHASGGGCRSPIGALASVEGSAVRILGGMAGPDGKTAVETIDAPAAEARDAAARLASELVARVGRLAGTQERARRVVVTRPAGASGPLVDALLRHSLEPLLVPAIAIEVVPATAALDAAVAPLAAADWVVATSANGVRALAPHLDRVGIDPSALPWVALGSATAAAIRATGAAPAWLPSRPEADAIAAELPLTPGDRVAIVRGRIGGDGLAVDLRARGGDVEEVVVYDTLEGPAASRPLAERALDAGPSAVVLASPSAARGLVALAGPRRAELLAVPAVCIGRRTAAAAAEIGYRVAGVAEVPDPEALAVLVASVVSGDSVPHPQEVLA